MIKKSISLFIIFCVSVTLFAQDGKEPKNKDSWVEVVLTKNPDDVKGLLKVGEVEGKAQKVFGSQSSLRKKARENIKKETSKIGATIVLIDTDEFTNTPINNVYISGIAWRICRSAPTESGYMHPKERLLIHDKITFFFLNSPL
jgi:hypothetical protein